MAASGSSALSTVSDPMIFLDSTQDRTFFDSRFQELQHTYGSLKFLTATETIGTILERFKTLSEVALQKSEVSLSEKNFMQLVEDVLTITKMIHSHLEKKVDSSTQGNMAYLAFLACVVGSRVLNQPALSDSKSGQCLQEIWKRYTGMYDLVELHYLEGLKENAYLQSLRSRVFANIRYNSEKFQEIALTKKEIQFHIDRKNKKAQEFGGSFHGKLIDHQDSERSTQIEPECVKKVYEEILTIRSETSPRTQMIVYPLGSYGHVCAFDIGYNADRQVIEMISLESARSKFQWDFLKALTDMLQENGLNYEIAAIQTRLQKNFDGCPVFALLLAEESSKLSFASLKTCSPEIQAAEFKKIFFNNVFGEDLILSQQPPLKNVTWLPVSVLGTKAVLMGQSTQEIEENLKQIQGIDAKKVMEEWFKFYECHREAKQSYYNYHLNSMTSKFRGIPFDGLTVKKIFEKLKAKPEEVMNEGLALRRQAAGYGPLREMEFFISILEKHKALDRLNIQGGAQERTPLHWAIVQGKVSRACLLLSKGAQSDLPDKQGKTAKDYFKTASEPMRSNSYLQKLLS